MFKTDPVENQYYLYVKSRSIRPAVELLVEIEASLESVNTSACINKLLLSCIERMAL